MEIQFHGLSGIRFAGCRVNRPPSRSCPNSTTFLPRLARTVPSTSKWLLFWIECQYYLRGNPPVYTLPTTPFPFQYPLPPYHYYPPAYISQYASYLIPQHKRSFEKVQIHPLHSQKSPILLLLGTFRSRTRQDPGYGCCFESYASF